jgi:uncharacterized protein (DUF1697 family)
MNKYIIFLRAVNVSGKNIIKMAELKEKLISAGFQQVRTYIQSGNICLVSKSNVEQVLNQVKSLIKKEFGHDIDVFVLTENEIQEALDINPFSKELPPNKVFVTFMDRNPEKILIEDFKSLKLQPEEFHVTEKLFYFYLPDGMANSKLNNNFIEKKLKVKSTGRNLNTINKILNLIKQ